jgi:hypothetical protein
MISMLAYQGQFEMMVLLFKNVKNFVNEESLFQALEANQCKLNPEEYEKLRKQIEA